MNMIDKIASLRAKIPANGATEEEALASLALADKLMQKHGISEKDLENIEFKRDMREGSYTQKQKTEHPSQKWCAMTIAGFCGIKVWTGRTTGNKKYLKMFGLNDDVAMAEFLTSLVHDSMDRGWKEFLQHNPKRPDVSRHTEYWSFMMGFANRINEKLQDLIDARVHYYDSTGTDLIVIKSALVDQGLDSLLPDLNLKAGKRSSTRVAGGAYKQGQSAGDNVNLQRPIGKQASGGRLLS